MREIRLRADASLDRDVSASLHQDRLELLLVAWMVAGVQTQYQNLRSMLPAGVRTSAIETVPYIEGGRIERLALPPTLRSTLRSTMTLLRPLKGGRIDAVWSQVALPLLPFALTRGALDDVPIFYAIDCTPSLLWGFGGHYAHVTDPNSTKGRLTSACFRLFFKRCAGLLPWSAWAAESMTRDYGVDPGKIHVLAPGIDVEMWRPQLRRAPGARVQLLFVGADFERKGGQLLLDVFRRELRETCELHLVTRAAVEPEPGVHVHGSFQPGAAGLLDLYQRCDALVLPTLADCFSMAALEAMACSLPVVISSVGGIPEIVVDGQTGALIPVGDGTALRRAIKALVADPGLRVRWGRTGRKRVTVCFNAAVQAARTARILAEASVRRPSRRSARRPSFRAPTR